MGNGSDEITIRSGDNKGFVHAVMNEDLEAVEYYLSLGMNVNFMDPEIMTSPLIEAVKVNNVTIIKALLKAGGNPKAVSQLGESALGLAKANQNSGILHLFSYKRTILARLLEAFKSKVGG